jgi:hypothetical protein
MDMKKILQALDSVDSKPAVVGVDDMKRFVSVIKEGQGPLNRLTQAESIAVYHSEPVVARETITSPVLNVAADAKPSMIGKYFKAVEQELDESADRTKHRARQLAERVIERVTGGEETPPGVNRLTGKPNVPPSAEPAPTNVKPSGATVEYGGATYSVNVFGDGIRPRIGPGNKAVGAKAYIIGDKMYVLLDTSTQEDMSEDKDPCWDSHKMVGTKKKNGKTVPNCVPK